MTKLTATYDTSIALNPVAELQKLEKISGICYCVMYSEFKKKEMQCGCTLAANRLQETVSLS
jgi:hypothetical protein